MYVFAGAGMVLLLYMLNTPISSCNAEKTEISLLQSKKIGTERNTSFPLLSVIGVIDVTMADKNNSTPQSEVSFIYQSCTFLNSKQLYCC